MQIMNNLSLLDLSVFAIWITLSIGVIIIRRLKNLNSKTSDKDYILMGRKLTLPLFVATLVSSWYGGVFGVTQIAFEHGIYNFITQGVFWYIAYIIFAYFLVKKIHQKNALTFPDLIKKTYGEKSAKLAAILLIFKALPITYALSLGAFIQTMFGLSLPLSIVAGTSVVVLYTCISDFRSVVYSDFLQFCCMYFGVITVVIFSFYSIGNPLVLVENLPPHYFTPSGKHEFSTIILWLFIAFSATLISPVFYQRCMAAGSSLIAKKGIIISTVFWIVFDICTTLGGMYAKVHMPDANSLNAYLLFGLEILPSGFRGIFLAGITATVISTLDSFVFASSTLFSYDLRPKKYTASGRYRTISVLSIGFLTVIIALQFDNVIEDVWITLEGYFGALLIIPIIWSYFIKTKISDNAFIFTAFLSISIMLIKDVFFRNIKIEAFYFGLIATLTVYSYIFLYERSIKKLICKVF